MTSLIAYLIQRFNLTYKEARTCQYVFAGHDDYEIAQSEMITERSLYQRKCNICHKLRLLEKNTVCGQLKKFVDQIAKDMNYEL
jgi:DNA-binding CsgD family transcriptional regulator